MANTVIGFFDDHEDAQEAIEQLTSAGFDRNRIDLSSGRSNDTGSAATSDTLNRTMDMDKTTGQHSGTAIGNFFRSLFNDDDQANRYSQVAEGANAIVTVHAATADEAERAADILDDAGAVDVDERAANIGYGSGQQLRSGGNDLDLDTQTSSAKGNQEGRIDRVEEELQVGKRSVQTGGVRVRSRIIERPVEEQLRLREEHVTVNRTPVNRTLSAADYEAFEEKNIELSEYAEVPVVNKEARVVEEISIGKNATEREETVRDTVRKTEVDIENLANNPGAQATDTWKNSERNSSEDRS